MPVNNLSSHVEALLATYRTDDFLILECVTTFNRRREELQAAISTLDADGIYYKARSLWFAVHSLTLHPSLRRGLNEQLCEELKQEFTAAAETIAQIPADGSAATEKMMMIIQNWAASMEELGRGGSLTEAVRIAEASFKSR